MTNIELYINGKLCDTQQPENMGIRLNRVLINPAELSTKDAQYSYSITLPSSPINDEVFNYANVEEVRAKFNNAYSAVLIMDGITIFDGLFKMSEVTPNEYKGNLVLPAEKTVKDLFGETKMNELTDWWQPMVGTKEEAFNAVNKTEEDDADCMFPFVLYGLLPKVPKVELKTEGDDEQPTEKQSYTDKNIWDEYVRLGIEDFPPSINCLKTISQIFKSKGYTISGNVFDDERLKRLYMSYQNPTSYVQQWNWGDLAQIEIEGNWTNWKGEVTPAIPPNGQAEVKEEHESEQYYFKNEDDQVVYVANLLSSSTTRITKLVDSGTNVTHAVTGSVEKKDRINSWQHFLIWFGVILIAGIGIRIAIRYFLKK